MIDEDKRGKIEAEKGQMETGEGRGERTTTGKGLYGDLMLVRAPGLPEE
jgi:hypothetical protein